MKSRTLLFTLICTLLAWGSADAGNFEDQVRARWRGAWLVSEIESYSTCSGTYFNNDVSGTLVRARAGRKFEPGELTKVDKVQLRRSKVKLYVTVAAHTLIPRRDGPFTLYDDRSCRIEFEVAVPRAVIKSRNVEEVDRLLRQVGVRFSTERPARDSELWNGRERKDYPVDYELTLARHAAWKVEQINLTIDERIDVALEEAEQLTEHVEVDAAYLNGFAAGTHDMREWNERSCNNLLAGRFETVRSVAPDTHKGDEEWCDGYYDGQQLLYSITLARRLAVCYVQVPAVPES